MRTNPLNPSTRKLLAVASIVVLLLNACSFSLLDIPGLGPSTVTPEPGPTVFPRPSAAVTFTVALPVPLLPGETLNLSVVDEVTGLGLNPVNYAMQGMDTLHYTITIPFPINSVIKYRYMRQGVLPTLEDDAANQPVRYRMVYITGPGMVEDIISSWADNLFNSPSGRLTGQVTNAADGKPIPDILVSAGGRQTLSDSNGKFIIENLPAGTHNLVFYALNGAYQTFQQGARIEEGKSTPVTLALTPSQMVNVVFIVSVPDNTVQNVPIRLGGNLYQLGNTFGDLQGGLSTVATRMPVLTPLQDGRYTLTLALPAGIDIQYKYTLGDGFWNAEHTGDGIFISRQLILPAIQSTIQIEDVVSTWQAGPSSPILFEASAPAGTPVGDTISIQFNPYGWTEPIPMWPLGNNRWVYQLFSPLNMLGEFQYRYCRNDQCGVADDVQTSPGHLGRPVTTSLTRQDLQDTIMGWTWFVPLAPSSLVGLPVMARAAGFWAGMEFSPDFDPTWQAWMPQAIQNVQSLYANWLVLGSSWTVSQTAPFVFSPIPGADPLWADTQETVSRARASNLSVALFPSANLPSNVSSWWASAPRDAAWWDAWFNRYAAFAAYHADLAARSGAQALILGGDWVLPSLPGGLINGSSSGVPADAEARWRAIILDVRTRFSGSVYWALSYPGGLDSAPGFSRDLDGVYLLWYAPLTSSSTPTTDEMRITAGTLLDSKVQPFQTALGKPVVIAAAYPSANGSGQAAFSTQALFQPGTTQAPLNLQAQVDVYQALMMAVNERSWVSGFVSRGYYPPVGLQDASASIRSKPAADVLWYWFGRFLGVVH